MRDEQTVCSGRKPGDPDQANLLQVPLSGQLSNWYPVVDNFGTFEWPRASDLEELIIGLSLIHI